MSYHMQKKFTIENNIIKGVQEPCTEKNKHNFGQVLLNSLKKYGNQTAQIKVETGEQRTFENIKDRSIRCALWLKKQGVGVGDVVVLCTHNQLDTCIPGLATFYVGAIHNGWDNEMVLETARFFMSLVQPKVIFSCEQSASVLLEAAKLENFSTTIIVYGKYAGLESLTDILSQQSEEEVRTFQPEGNIKPEDIGSILFSSGSTGVSKAATFCYDSLLENFLSFYPTGTVTGLYYSAISWISGTALLYNFLLTGSTVIIHDKFDPDQTLKIIEQYKVNWILMPPVLMTQCYKANILSKYKLPSLKVILSGSSPLNSEIYKIFKKHYPHVDIVLAYGLTELGSLASYNVSGKAVNSVGFIKPNRQLKVVDITTKKTLGPNENGELCIKSPGTMIGYYKNPAATKQEIDKEGWLHTGDIGYFNEDGEIFITDRLKEMIKYKAHAISPTEIEEVLLKHPGVTEVAVVPIPDIQDGDIPMAFVKKSSKSDVTEEELVELSSTLGKYKTLWGGVKFVDKLPRTASGKVFRHELKKLAKTYAKP